MTVLGNYSVLSPTLLEGTQKELMMIMLSVINQSTWQLNSFMFT